MARKKRAVGGKVHEINGKGSPIMEEALKTRSDGFKRGGKIKAKKEGGKVEGEMSMPRLDKRARGGRALTSRGGAPFSSAGTGGEMAGKSNSGHEGE